MISKSQDGVDWLEFELLAPFKFLQHAVFLRRGGFSEGPFDSLNLSANRGDNPDSVAANVAKVKKVLSIEHLAAARQVHSNGIVFVNDPNNLDLGSHDALLTQQPNIGLQVTHADCQAAIFYDPIQHALATVHCGWRGQVCNIYGKVVDVMKAKYHSKPENIHVAIAPSLGPQHSEFINFRTEFPEEFWRFQIKSNYFDLWAIGTWQLVQAKILASHIQMAEICTYANPSSYFSYRRSKGTTGVHGTIARLRETTFTG